MTDALISVPRARAVLVCLLAAFTALAGRVAYLQTYGRQQTIKRAERQQHQTQVVPHRRGCIFDRNGMELAGTIQTPTLFVDPKFMQDQFQEEGRSLVEMDRFVARLAKIIDKDAFELSQLLGERATSRYVRVVDHLDETTCAEIRKLDLPGVGLEPASVRNYPAPTGADSKDWNSRTRRRFQARMDSSARSKTRATAR
jgi:cell division protein FtsI (penicillin-binding protein 3)